MPLPKPNKNEQKSHFISRCMSNTNIQNDFKTQEQRVAVCYNLFKHKQSKASYVVDTGSDTYIYTITQEDEEKNPLDDKKDDSDTSNNPSEPSKTPDKWPTEAPNALDDTKAGGDSSIAPPSLHSGGINPNPDNSKNFPIKPDGDWEHPSIDDMKWQLANEDSIPLNYENQNPDINKLKEWYISSIDSMPEDVLEGKWPLSFDKIEMDFDRPNKTTTPETKLKEKQTKEFKDVNKIANKDKPFAI